MNTSLRSLLSRNANTLVCNALNIVAFYALFVTTINFIYRYFGIVRNRKLSGKEYILMLAMLLSILILIFTWDYFLIRTNDETEFVMTDEYIDIFGGPNVTNKEELRMCIRGDLVTKN
jgi:hypothetical protein